MIQTSQSLPGWVSGPDTRGSIDIIFSSFLAILLCTWTSLCLNVPHPADGELKILLRKIKWMLRGVLMPEAVLAVSFTQHASARRSVQRFRELGYSHWTLRHGHFANMGGILLLPDNGTPFVADSSQVAFLVEKKYMECPNITAEEIWDKSKADFFTKSLALLQSSWFLFQLLGRAIVLLPITALEIFAGAIVFCSFGTFFCWLHKPNDVRKGITLKIGVSLHQIVSESEEAAVVFRHHINHMPPRYPTIAKAFCRSPDGQGQPLVRFSNGTFPGLTVSHKLAFIFVGEIFATFHLAAWNSHFPTHFELLGWQIASSVITGTSLLIWLFEVLLFPPDDVCWEQLLNPFRCQELSSQWEIMKHGGESASTQANRNSSTVRTKKLGLRLHAVYRLVICAVLIPLYVISRLFLVVTALSSLRSQPAGVYTAFSIKDLSPR
ncbi:hypothetical protein F4679DRAFT_584035 [Xylaria curta]|nr:hypothetical protein F4679DRAFT_584035 [Xylaria curta]